MVSSSTRRPGDQYTDVDIALVRAITVKHHSQDHGGKSQAKQTLLLEEIADALNKKYDVKFHKKRQARYVLALLLARSEQQEVQSILRRWKL